MRSPFDAEAAELGSDCGADCIAVGEAETKDMIQGSNPNPQIVQAFGNPQTRELDRSRLNSFLTSLKSAKADDPMKVQWKDFVTQMVQQKRTEKYLNYRYS